MTHQVTWYTRWHDILGDMTHQVTWHTRCVTYQLTLHTRWHDILSDMAHQMTGVNIFLLYSKISKHITGSLNCIFLENNQSDHSSFRQFMADVAYVPPICSYCAKAVYNSGSQPLSNHPPFIDVYYKFPPFQKLLCLCTLERSIQIYICLLDLIIIQWLQY